MSMSDKSVNNLIEENIELRANLAERNQRIQQLERQVVELNHKLATANLGNSMSMERYRV